MNRSWSVLVVGILLCSCLPEGASAQFPVEVAREDGVLGELGMRWKYDGPLVPSEDGVRRALSPPVVSSIVPCSPAHRAGLEPGDVLVRVDGREGTAGMLFPNGTPGTRYRLELRRGSEEWTVFLEVGPRRENPPPPVTASPVGTLEQWGCPPSSRR